MSKTHWKISDKITQHPAVSAVIFLAVWAAIMNGIYLLAEYVIPIGLTLLLGFMLVYPAMTFALCFYHAKRCSITPLMPFGMIPVVTCEYLLLDSFRAIIPNMLVTTALCMLFGSGMGNIFADKEYIAKLKKQRRDKRLHEDMQYRKILDDKKEGKKK